MNGIDNSPIREFLADRQREITEAKDRLDSALEGSKKLEYDQREIDEKIAWNAFWSSCENIILSALELCNKLINNSSQLIYSAGRATESNYPRMQTFANVGATKTARALADSSRQMISNADNLAKEMKKNACEMYADVVQMVVRCICGHREDVKTLSAINRFEYLSVYVCLIKKYANDLDLSTSAKRDLMSTYETIVHNVLAMKASLGCSLADFERKARQLAPQLC